MEDKDKTKKQPIDELVKLRKRVTELEKSEQHKISPEFLPDGYLSVDLKGKITECNSAFLNLTGYSREDIVNKHFTKLPTLRLKDIPLYIKMFNSAIRGKFPRTFEFKWIHKDKTTHWGESLIGIIRKKHKISGMNVILRDITERKRADAELKKGEKKYRELVDNSVVGVYETSLDGTLLYVNQALATIFDFKTPQDMISENALFRYKNPEDRKKLIDLLRKNKKLTNYEIQAVTKTGKDIVIITNSTLLEDSFSGMVIDITERKNAEKTLQLSEHRFRTLIEETTDSVFCYEYNPPIPTNLSIEDKTKEMYRGILVECNDVCARSYGASRAEEVIGKKLTELFRASPGSLDALFRTFFQNGYKTVDAEGREVLDDGSERYYLNNTHGVIEKGKLVRVWGTFRDITEQKKAEKIQTAILEISESALLAENLESFYHSIHNIVGELMPAKNNFYIALYEENSEMLTFPYFVDKYEENPGPQMLGKGLTEYVLRKEKPLLASPEVFNKLEKKGEVASIGPSSIDWLGVPLKIQDKTIGVLVVQSYTEGIRYSEEDKNILVFISNQIAMVIDRMRAEEELLSSKIELQKLAAHMQVVTEQERGLIASELHDEVGQALTGLKMDIFVIKNKISKDQKEIPSEFERMENLIDDTIGKLRKIYSDLRPNLLEHFGVGEAMSQHCKDFQEQSGIKCTYFQNPEEIILDENRSIALYRIMQGAINNIKWHSRATKVNIRLEEKGPNLKLTIKDNGIGIKEKQIKSSDSFGLIGMRERARYLGGELKIKGIPDKGTTVMLEIPIKKIQ